MDTRLVIRNSNRSGSLVKSVQDLPRLLTRSRESISWIAETMKSNNKTLILILKASYEIPAELSLDGKSKRDSAEAVFIWVKEANRFEETTPTAVDMILDYVHQMNLWNSKDTG